jgi:hypothetical protein
MRAVAVALTVLAAVGLASCSARNSSLTREEVQGQWSSTVDGHTVDLELASDGTVTVTGIPVAAASWHANPDDPPAELDWSEVTDLSGTWTFFEPYAANRASVGSSLSDSATGEPVAFGLDLDGEHLVVHYGYFEYGERLEFTRTTSQTPQPQQQLLSRDDSVGTWVGGTSAHEATVEFDADGTVAFSNLPIDLLRSDGAAEIDWRSTLDFTAKWLWAQNPITPHSAISVSIHPRPSGVEFDGTVMRVSVRDSTITLRMDSGQVTWDRHVDFQQLPDQSN